jgi:hypothetical protein
MDSSSKQFYLCEEDLPQMSSIEIVIQNESEDGSYTGPAALLPHTYDYTETQLSYYACNDCMTGAITPESKNSSNASLISSNSNAKDYSTLQTIMEITIPVEIVRTQEVMCGVPIGHGTSNSVGRCDRKSGSPL